MTIRKALRQKAKIRCALQAPSGAGKTMSALLLAHGLCSDWEKIAVIDTENGSADLYSHLGAYNVIPLAAPFAPEKYIAALQECEKAAMEVVIIDSLSHEWDGTGGILDIHSQMMGNSFTNWSKVTPRHNAFVQAILQSPCHIIGTIRSKQDYVLSERNGKMVPEKVGLKGVQRDGLDYEFTVVFDLDIKHFATASKDRTQLFIDKPSFVITDQTGREILEWCNSGAAASEFEILQRIEGCKSLQELLQLYNMHPKYGDRFKEQFVAQKKRLQAQPPASQFTHQKTNENGRQ